MPAWVYNFQRVLISLVSKLNIKVKMGSYFSMLQWPEGEVQAPAMSKVEVEFDIAKQKIDSEKDEIVHEIEAATLQGMSSDPDSFEFEATANVKVVDAQGESSSPWLRTAPSPEAKHEKKWYHKFTGDIQRNEEVSVINLAERRIQALEKRASEMKAELDKQLERANTRNKIRLLALQQKIHPDFRGKEWRFDEKKNFNFAVVGCSGVGKSTFINSLLGLKPHEPGAARVSAGVEGTLLMHPYCLPALPFVRIWDVPGGSGIDRPADTYFDMHCLDLFDAVMYLHEGRHHALQALVVAGCAATKTPVYIVVTKMDLLVESQLENLGLEESLVNIEEAIRSISQAVIEECTIQNQRFFQQEAAGSALMAIARRRAAEEGTPAAAPGTEDPEMPQLGDVPFFFVCKRFECRFGSFDAAKVVSSMRDAASARLPAAHTPTRKLQKQQPPPPPPTTAQPATRSPLKLKLHERMHSLKASPSMSPQGSPMPFTRESLKVETVSSLIREMGVAEDGNEVSTVDCQVMSCCLGD